MKEFWKNYAKTFWKNKFFWEVVKAKSYTDQELRKWCNLLKIARDHLSRTDTIKRASYLKFCGYDNSHESFEIGESKKLEIFLTCKGLNEKIFTLQQGKSNVGFKYRQGILKDFNNDFSYAEIKSKYPKAIIEDLCANGRNALNWWDDWGYAVRVDSGIKKFLYITEIGNDSCDEYKNKDACLAIFREQIKKYQIPLFKVKQKNLFKDKSNEIRVKPYYAIVQVLLRLNDNYIDKEEYVLFVNKIKNNDNNSIEECVDLIKEYRKLSQEEKKELIEYIKLKDQNLRKDGTSKIYQTTRENSDKSIQAFMSNSGDLFSSHKLNNRYFLRKEKRNLAEELLSKFTNNPTKQYHFFVNIYEYNLAIGKRNYENVEEILKRNYFNLNKPIPITYQNLPDNVKSRALLETKLQLFYEKNIEILNKHFDLKLKIIERKNSKNRKTKEYNTYCVGEIDLLCKDKISNKYYVVEIKRDDANGETLGQLMQYMGWVQKEFSSSPEGIIICNHQSEKYSFAKSYLESCTKKPLNIRIYLHNFSDRNLPNM